MKLLLRSALALTAGAIFAAGPALAQDQKAYETDVGVATIRDFEDYTRRILNRERFEIQRFDNDTHGTVETDWKMREPFEDEVERGVIAARSRIVLRTRPRGSTVTANTLRVQRVTFIMENLVQMEENGDWIPIESQDDMEDYAKDLARRFEREFRSAMRRWE